jgi:hypothetical protein
MSALPLTHHEILTLVEPFARRGRHVDLGASDRAARRILFRPLDHGTVAGTPASLHETLSLDSLETGSFRVTRTLRDAAGITATLSATGTRPAELLAAIESVAPDRHFSGGGGYTIARSYSLGWIDGNAPPVAGLTEGLVQLDGLRLSLQLSGTRGVSADVSLTADPDRLRDIPEDLLAVLGWSWARLIRTPLGWKSRLRLRGDAPRKTARAERALEQAARHLARTLAEAPQCFHERLWLARWGVFFRRGIPVLTFLAIVIAVALIPRNVVEGNPRAWILLFHVPTALIALSFCLQELAQYEIPPVPRRGAAGSWGEGPARRAQ